MIRPEDHLPEIAPRWGNRFTRWVGRCILRGFGYKIEGTFPDERKMIIIASPHTSNWDLLLAIGVIMALGVKLNFMMKKEGFVFPFKNLFIGLGGVPIDRSKPKRSVIQILKAFKSKDTLWFVMAPEGTRKSVTNWQPGFVRIAHKAGVPIFVMGLDSRTKTLHLDKMVVANEKAREQAEDLRLYSSAKYCGLNPENN